MIQTRSAYTQALAAAQGFDAPEGWGFYRLEVVGTRTINGERWVAKAEFRNHQRIRRIVEVRYGSCSDEALWGLYDKLTVGFTKWDLGW